MLANASHPPKNNTHLFLELNNLVISTCVIPMIGNSSLNSRRASLCSLQHWLSVGEAMVGDLVCTRKEIKKKGEQLLARKFDGVCK